MNELRNHGCPGDVDEVRSDEEEDEEEPPSSTEPLCPAGGCSPQLPFRTVNETVKLHFAKICYGKECSLA